MDPKCVQLIRDCIFKSIHSRTAKTWKLSHTKTIEESKIRRGTYRIECIHSHSDMCAFEFFFLFFFFKKKNDFFSKQTLKCILERKKKYKFLNVFCWNGRENVDEIVLFTTAANRAMIFYAIFFFYFDKIEFK